MQFLWNMQMHADTCIVNFILSFFKSCRQNISKLCIHIEVFFNLNLNLEFKGFLVQIQLPSLLFFPNSMCVNGEKVEMEAGSVLDTLQTQIQILKKLLWTHSWNFLSAALKQRQNSVDSICMHLHITWKQNNIYTHFVKYVCIIMTHFLVASNLQPTIIFH